MKTHFLKKHRMMEVHEHKSDFQRKGFTSSTDCQLSESGAARLAAPSVLRNAIGAATQAPAPQTHRTSLCLYTHIHTHRYVC